MNRGVDGRDLFLGSSDYVRFTHNLYEFNDTSPAPQFTRRSLAGVGHVGHTMSNMPREKIVEIHGWCLMKNHYHLLLSERREGGISLFLRKLNVGYARAFNEKRKRSGVLFQGRTKKVLVERGAHFNYILDYIHLNPLDYFAGAETWRLRSHGGIENTSAVFSYLETYRWSSYRDYIGEQNFPSLLHKDPFESNPVAYREHMRQYLEEAEADLGAMRLE